MSAEDFDEPNVKYWSNWTQDYLDNLDTSQYPFPNTLWHVKPAKEIAIKTSITLLVGVSGIYLNFVIILTLVKNRWLWTASNYLLWNLAAVDLLTLLLCPWFLLVRDFYQHYALKNFGCRFEGYLQGSLLLASVGAVMLVTYDRLAAAALTAEARVTKSAAPKLIFISWITSLGLALPFSIKRVYTERQWLDYLEAYCVEDFGVLGIYWHLIIFLLVWTPLGVMTLSYGTIMFRLEWRTRVLTSRGGGQLVSRAKGKAMRITACVLLTALVCRLPFTILMYWRNRMEMTINAVDGPYDAMLFTSQFLMYVNCALNPLIYGFTNTRFRRAMDRTPGVACCKYGSWCCACNACKREELLDPKDKNTEKIFIILDTPVPNKKLSKVIKNILHINKDSVQFALPKVEEATTKPTRVTPLP